MVKSVGFFFTFNIDDLTMTARKFALQALERGKQVDLSQLPDLKDQRLAKNLYWGTLRHYYALRAWLNESLLSKPLKKKESRLFWLILLGLYQIRHLNIPNHAAVNETVRLCKMPWQKKLVNACLRKACQTIDYQSEDLSAQYNHPIWLIDLLKKYWPEHWQSILIANQSIAPQTLRVSNRDLWLNEMKTQAQAHPNCESAVLLSESLAIQNLPGYEQGKCFVQDIASQWAIPLLDLKSGQAVLDVCSAPGGKACHMSQHQKEIDLICIEKSEARVPRLKENLNRANIQATVLIADAAHYDFEKQFDRILLDPPCSATGIIRRHPDIKLNRQPEDLIELEKTQAALLEHIWSFLKPGGKLLYTTCSILPIENEYIIEAFLKKHSEATVCHIDLPNSVQKSIGIQVLPTEPAEISPDGFYYCLLEKK